MGISEQVLEETIFTLVKNASIELPMDVRNALQASYAGEQSLAAKGQLGAILDNCRIASQKQIGLCQDTGMPMFYAELGLDCRLEGDPMQAAIRAVVRATAEVPLRPNVINPLTRQNSGTNTGWGIPYFHWEMISGSDHLDLTAVPKGFGSESRAAQCWVVTSEGRPRRRQSRARRRRGFDGRAMPAGDHRHRHRRIRRLVDGHSQKGAVPHSHRHANPDPTVAALETEICEAVNAMGLGPMGVGGNTYALGVHAEISGSHTAIVPVSVIMQCWACRYSKARIHSDGRVEYLTHPTRAESARAATEQPDGLR